MSTPEGWYPSQMNPNEEAHWDGQKWTGETRPIVAVNPAPAPDAAGPAAEPGEAAAVPAAPAKRRFPVWAMIVIPVAAVLVLAAVLIVTLVAVPAANEAERQSAAVAMCKQKTLDQLKAPASAKFGPMKPMDLMTALSASAVEKGEEPIKATPAPDGSQSYLFNSYVDAQNGFGALVRNDVSCIIKVKDGKAVDDDSVALVTAKD
jgi:hypothetical protein